MNITTHITTNTNAKTTSRWLSIQALVILCSGLVCACEALYEGDLEGDLEASSRSESSSARRYSELTSEEIGDLEEACEADAMRVYIECVDHHEESEEDREDEESEEIEVICEELAYERFDECLETEISRESSCRDSGEDSGADSGADSIDDVTAGQVEASPNLPLAQVISAMRPAPSIEQWTLHDPSELIDIDGVRTIAVTGKEQADGYTCGLELWTHEPGAAQLTPQLCLLHHKPEWVSRELPSNDGAYWAPNFLDEDRLYYSASSGFDDEDERSCVGLLVRVPTDSGFDWIDSGAPITCSHHAPRRESVIDPAAFIDESQTSEAQSAYLVYGGGEIYLSQINPETGAIITDDQISNPITLARGPYLDSDGSPAEERAWIEAAYLTRHDGQYYLFLNWFTCCQGADSTYELRVGRSSSLLEPFVDQEGRRLLDGGGTLLLGSEGERRGPGHVGLYTHPQTGTTYLTHHYYPESGAPWATLGVRRLVWRQGWPQVTGPARSLPESLAELD